MKCVECGKEKNNEAFFRTRLDSVDQPCKECWLKKVKTVRPNDGIKTEAKNHEDNLH